MKAKYCLIGLALIHSCGKVSDSAEDLACDIEPAAMYEQLGIVDEVSTGLAQEDYLLVDSLLVYDSHGSLIARQGLKSDALGSKSIVIPGLPDGTYTFVIFQMCTKAGEPDLWTAVNAGQLEMLHFDNPNVCVDGVQAFGVKKESVTIRDGALGTTLIPRPAGSIVDFQIDNYVAKNFVWFHDELPPVWLYGTDHIAGYSPDSGRFLASPEQNKAIGYLEKGQSRHKFFLLTDGSQITVSVEEAGFSLYQDTINLPPGSNAVLYYSFAPKTFFNACLGTPEVVAAFRAGHSEDSCTLYPCLQWGYSREEVDTYVKNRMFLPCEDGKVSVGQNDITVVEYNPAPGLTEYYFLDSAGKLVEVDYDYDGPVELKNVISCMGKQGFMYIGSVEQYYDSIIYNQYLSADGQTELWLYQSDIVYAVGYGSWFATFRPFNPDDLNLLEF